MSSVNGLADVQRRLLALGSKMENFVKLETQAVGFQIAADAKNNASSIANAPPELKQRISSETINNGFGTRVIQNFLPLGAYIEFGTGAFVEVSPEWKEMAFTFYKNGKGTLRAHPYLYPAFILNRDKYLAILRKKLNEFTI